MTARGETSSRATPFGPFLLERRIAVGGSADVYLARPKTGANPAPRLVVKRLAAGRTEEQFDVLDREAELHRAVVHPNVVKVFGAGMVGSEPYLAMEYVEGVDLYRLLSHLGAEQRRLPLGVSMTITRQLAAALEAVHTACDANGTPLAIVHRDVTPSNVYLSVRGEVKLGDFGIARVSEHVRPPSADAGLKGKFAYLAPEQIAGEPFDGRADLFALAAILGEMLIGERVFPGSGQLAVLLAIRDANIEPLRRREPLLPPGMFAICERALSRDPDDRFATAAELSEALAPYELPSRELITRDLAELVGRAGDSKLLAKQIKDSVDRMRAVAKISSSTSQLAADSVPPASLSAEIGPDRARAEPGRPRADQATALPDAPVEPSPPRAGEAPVPAGAHGSPRDELSRVRRTDGRVLENITLPRLLELVATGELNGDDQVAFGAAEFRRIADVAELARHLLPSTTQTTGQLFKPGTPDYRAMLGDTPMMAVLAQMRHERETGALFVERADRTGAQQRKELYLMRGRLLHVASSDRTELLGEYLVRRGALTREQLETALASLARYGGRLGDTVVGLGFVQAVDVFRTIRDQGRDRVAAICGWKRGSVAFYRDTGPGHVEFPLDLDLASPMMAGAIVQSQGNPRALLPADAARLEPGPRHYKSFDPAEIGTAPSSLRMVPDLASQRQSIGAALAHITQPRAQRRIGDKEAAAALVAAKALGWAQY